MENSSRGDIAINQDKLDFLRGVAAFYVVLNHTRGSFWIGGKTLLAIDPTPLNYVMTILLQFTALGQEFVVLFFVLSGFAMRHSLTHSKSNGRFYLKRILRIWPPYIIAVMFALVCETMTSGSAVRNAFARMLVYVDVSTPMTPQFWSLPYEIVFYALCPLILTGSRRVLYLAAVAAIASVATLLLKGPLINPFDSFFANFVGNELLFFACGAIAYDNLHRIPSMTPKYVTVLSICALIIALMAKIALGGSNMLSNIVMIVMTILLVRNLPDKITGMRWLNIGFFSYSIYIFHYAIIAVFIYAFRQRGIDPLAIQNPFAWMTLIPIILGICFLMYVVSERWSNRLVARLRTRPAGGDPATGSGRPEGDAL